jgi:hypothetical protein
MEAGDSNDARIQRKLVEARSMKAKNFLGGLVIALAATAIIVGLPDIKRYIRISTM